MDYIFEYRLTVFILVLILAIVGIILWKQEKRIRKLEQVIDLLGKHSSDVDLTLTKLFNVINDLLKAILTGLKVIEDPTKEDTKDGK